MKPIKDCYLAYPFDVDDGSDMECYNRIYNMAEHITINVEKIARHGNYDLSPVEQLIQELNVVKDCDAVCFCGDWVNDPVLFELCRIIQNDYFGYTTVSTDTGGKCTLLFSREKLAPFNDLGDEI